MKNSGVTAYWIEAATGSIRSHRFTSLPNNGSYEAEVNIKLASNPIDIVIIPDAQAGNDWAKQALLDLREKSQTMLEEVRGGDKPKPL